MLETLEKNQSLTYQKISKEDQERRKILGRLVGVCANFIDPTRNNRKYGEELWEKVFKNPIVKEKIINGGILGELGHPVDRLEIDMEKAAISMPEIPKKGTDGKLYAVFDILDTPNGHILKTLCDYGMKLGISSRGNGETYSGPSGEEIVDADTYIFECFDIVLLPAVESARLEFVTESLDDKKQFPSLLKSLQESINSANPAEKKIMEKTLSELHLNIDENQKDGCNMQKACENKDTPLAEEVIQKIQAGEAINDGSSTLLKNLQEVLKEKSKQDAQIAILQESIAVCNTKAVKLKEELARYKRAAATLSNFAEEKKLSTTNVEKMLKLEKENSTKLLDEVSKLKKTNKYLIEKISKKDNNLLKLNESLKIQKETLTNENNKLVENLQESNQNLTLKVSNLSASVEKANSEILSYKDAIDATLNEYINQKAKILGLKANEIKRRLPTSKFTLEDINLVCEDLVNFNVDMGSLPFNLGTSSQKLKMYVKPLADASLDSSEIDDEIDDSLLRIAKLK